ncbi:MAG: hypothetical protein ACFB5Z_15780 [Elainellaceae cyanobacterium]
MKFLLATTLLLSLLALPAEAQERDRSRRSVSQRVERLQQERRTGGRSTGERYTGERRTGGRSTGERYTGERYTGERYTGGHPNGERLTGERTGGSSFEIRSSDDDDTPRRGYDPIDLEYRRDSDRRIHQGSRHRDPIYTNSERRGSVRRGHRRTTTPRTVFGLSNERGVVIFEPDRTLIIRQRDRSEGRDIIQLEQERLGVDLPARATSTPVVAAPSQQQDPRLLHGERISPFAARVYAKEPLAGYEGPSTVYTAITRFSPGQTVTALQSAGGADGVQWYLVTADRQMAWVRGDRLLVNSQ